MTNYKELYFKLFNGITDVIEKLKELQIKAEELYISASDKSQEN